MKSPTLNKKQKAQETSVTKRESERAIYIDFEGFEDKSLTLIGCWCDGIFVQIVFDETLQSTASAKRLPIQEPKQTMQDLLKPAIDEDRRIIAYIQHEKISRTFISGWTYRPVYADARMIAVKWLNRIKKEHTNWKKEHQNWDIERGLKNFFELTGYCRPSHLGEKKPRNGFGM